MQEVQPRCRAACQPIMHASGELTGAQSARSVSGPVSEPRSGGRAHKEQPAAHPEGAAPAQARDGVGDGRGWRTMLLGLNA